MSNMTSDDRVIQFLLVIHFLFGFLVLSKILFDMLGPEGLTVLDVTISAVLSFLLVVLYSKQTQILSEQKQLMGSRYQPEIRVKNDDINNRKMVLLLSNEGNGVAKDLKLRIGIKLCFEDDPNGNYIEPTEVDLLFNDIKYQIKPQYLGLRRSSSSGTGFLRSSLSGATLSPSDEDTIFEAVTQIPVHEEHSDSGAGWDIPTVVTLLSESGVKYIQLSFVVVYNDITGEEYVEGIFSVRGIDTQPYYGDITQVLKANQIYSIIPKENAEKEIRGEKDLR